MLLIALSACKGKQEAETVDFSDIAKPSSKYAKTDSSGAPKAVLPVYYDSITAFSQQLTDSLSFDHNGIFTLDTLIYPDRFGALKADKWYYRSPKDSFVFMRWEFKNDIQTQNTFFNWLDCYGPKCKSIAVGDQVSFSKRGTLFLLSGKELIFVESGQKINAEKLLGVLSNLKKKKSWSYFTLQQPRGKASWKQVDKEGAILDLNQKLEK